MNIQTFNYTVDVTESILWQYNKATNLMNLIEQKQAWYDLYQTEFWQNWYNDVFNLLTANEFGLAVWSIILNVPLYIGFVPEADDAPIWGFNEYDPAYPDLENTYLNFFGTLNGDTPTGANFSTKGQIISLTDEEQRFLLRLRYYQLTTLGSICSFTAVDEAAAANAASKGLTIDYTIEDINTFLNYLCETSDIGYSGTIYVLDGLDMTITYVFTANDFPSTLLQVIIDLDILPRPAGVGISYFINPGFVTFGFNAYDPAYPDLENTYLNLNNGNFFSGLIL